MLLRDPKSVRLDEETLYWIDRAVATGDAGAIELAQQAVPRLKQLYAQSRQQEAARKARRAEIMSGLLKQCPRVERCVVFQNRWGGETARNCGSNPDYTDCS